MVMAKTPSQAEKSWCDQVVKEQRRVYQEMVKTMHHLRRMRALRLSGRTPRAFQALIGRGVRVPMSWALVQTVVGMIAKNTPQFRRIPRSEADKEASMRLQSSAWPLIETYSRMAKKPLYYLITDQLAGDGRAVAKFQRTVLEGYPAKQEGQADKEYNRLVEDYLNDRRPQPVRMSLVDPTTFWPSREEFDASFVVECGRRPLLSTMKSLGLTFGVNNSLRAVPVGATMTELELPGGMSPTSTVDVVTTDDNMFVTVDGNTLKYENEFGFINYVWRFGQVTSINDPMLESVSVIFPFAGVEPWLNTLMSVVLAWSILGGTPMLAEETQPSPNLPPGSEVGGTSDIPLGKRITLGVGKTIRFVDPPPVGPALMQAAELLMSIYEKAGITSMRRGFIGTRTPGLTFGSALEAAADMFAPLTAGLQGILEDICVMTWRAVEEFDTPLWVTGYGLEPVQGSSRKILSPWKISPKDIDGYYDLHCEVKLSNLQDVINRGMHASFMKGHRLWSDSRAKEYGGVDDPTQENIEIMKDDLRQSTLYKEQALKAALQNDPVLGQVVGAAEEQGISLVDLLNQGATAVQAMQQQAQSATPGEGRSGPTAGQARVYPQGATPPRGQPAPTQGGRSRGAPRRPTGPRQVRQGQQF